MATGDSCRKFRLFSGANKSTTGLKLLGEKTWDVVKNVEKIAVWFDKKEMCHVQP